MARNAPGSLLHGASITKKENPTISKGCGEIFTFSLHFCPTRGGTYLAYLSHLRLHFYGSRKRKFLKNTPNLPTNYPNFTHKIVTFSPQNCYFFTTKLLLFHHTFLKLIFAPGNALVARFFRIRGPQFFGPSRPNLTGLFTLACTQFFDNAQIFC